MWRKNPKPNKGATYRTVAMKTNKPKCISLGVRNDEEQKFLFPILTPLMHDLNRKIMKLTGRKIAVAIEAKWDEVE